MNVFFCCGLPTLANFDCQEIRTTDKYFSATHKLYALTIHGCYVYSHNDNKLLHDFTGEAVSKTTGNLHQSIFLLEKFFGFGFLCYCFVDEYFTFSSFDAFSFLFIFSA